MFKDIGYKIETLASVVCAIGIIASLGVGFVYVMNDLMLIGLIIALAGTLVSWLSTVVLYGFGTLVRTNEENNERTKRIEELLEQEHTLMSVLVKLTRQKNEQ